MLVYAKKDWRLPTPNKEVNIFLFLGKRQICTEMGQPTLVTTAVVGNQENENSDELFNTQIVRARVEVP